MRSRAIVLRRGPPPSEALLTAELRLAGLVAEVSALEEELARERRALARFEGRWREATGRASASLERARLLARRVRRLSDEVARIEEALRRDGDAPAPHGGRRTRPAPPGRFAARPRAAAAPASPAEGALPVAGALPPLGLKVLYRRLARLLHPDLVRGAAAERARASELMARANAAYAQRDRATLELLSERIGAGDVDPALPEPERLAHLAGRIAAVEGARLSLRAERERLAASPEARLRAEARRRASRGGDLMAETVQAAEAEAAQLREEALAAMDAVCARARAVVPPRAERRSAGRGHRLALEEVAGPLVRREADPGHGARLSPSALALARALPERAAGATRWQAALTLLAFFLELAGEPPEGVATSAALSERWEGLCRAWPGAPELAGALESPPQAVELGLRIAGGRVRAGLQLASADLRVGVRAALAHPAVRPLAAEVLSALGPRLPCRRCRAEVAAVQLTRVAGIEEVHGHVCPRCGTVLRSFWRFGERSGLDALAPVAVEVGLVAEQEVRLAGATLRFGMLGAERARLTTAALVARFRELCLAPAGLDDLPAGALALVAGGAVLGARARIPDGPVELSTRAGSRLGGPQLLRRLNAATARRFRA